MFLDKEWDMDEYSLHKVTETMRAGDWNWIPHKVGAQGVTMLPLQVLIPENF